MFNKIVKIYLYLLVILISGFDIAQAQEAKDDSARVTLPSVPTRGVLPGYDSLSTDSIIQAIQSKIHKEKETQEKRAPHLSIHDSLVTYILSNRMNVKKQTEKGFYHDAGDYFRSEPSFFVLDYIQTPLRKTVQPFGLSGARLNYLHDDNVYAPFEHLPENDGMFDMNDFPISLDDEIYIIPGATGYILGGKNGTASLLTKSSERSNTDAVTRFRSDNGNDGYSYTRGAYSKVFKSQKSIDMSVGYRDSKSPYVVLSDDAYHYFGDMYFPVSQDKAVRVVGQLYDREGKFAAQFDSSHFSIPRERFDRNLRITYINQNDSGRIKYESGYYHYRQGSYTEDPYLTRFNLTGHGLFLSREFVRHGMIYKGMVDLDYHEYNQPNKDFDRAVGEGSFVALKPSEEWSYSFKISSRYGLHIGLLPSAAYTMKKETENKMILLSFGFTSREPTLHELYKLYQVDLIYDYSTGLYADYGNPDLKSEKELVASAIYEKGSPSNGLTVSLTGGRIFDGIDWLNTAYDTSSATWHFSPVNNDKNFLDLSVKSEYALKDYFRLKGGGAYHLIDNEDYNIDVYQPDFQFYGGGELHYFWEQKLVHLYAYGDMTYSSKYDGWFEKGLGDQFVFNFKLTFQLKSFRFYYVFQNSLRSTYNVRDYMTIPDRFLYYGISWDFIN